VRKREGCVSEEGVGMVKGGMSEEGRMLSEREGLECLRVV
jgi:hypothetical protein